MQMGGVWNMNWIDNLSKKSNEADHKIFCSLLEYNPDAKFLDIGCGDGLYTRQSIESIGTSDVVGIDMKDWGVPFKLVKKNIEEGLPFGDNSFDVVTATNLIEHLSNTDLFVKEVYRILKIGGYTIIMTPNLASGLFIVDLLLDRQPGDADISDFFRIRRIQGLKTSIGFMHRRLFTMEGLERLLTYYGFEIENKKKVGYGRFVFGKVLRGLYACNLIVKARKI